MATASDSDVVTFPSINAAQVITLGTILPLVCINVLALRFYSRVRRKVPIGLDDWLMVPGLILYIGMCICMVIAAANDRMGYDSPDKSPPKALASYLIPADELFAKLLFSFQLMLTIGYGFVKCSIIALYQRIFVSHARNSPFDIVCKVTYVLIIAWSTTFFVMTILSCGTNPSAFWGTEEQKIMSCTNSFAAGQGLASSDLVLDVLLMVIPQPLIWQLKLSAWKKALVSGIIVLGCSCVGASIARIVLFTQIDQASRVGSPLDQNQIITLSMYYSALDGGLAVIAACLPTLRSLFKGWSVSTMVKSIKSSFSSTASGSRGSRMWILGDSSTQPVDVEKGAGVSSKVSAMPSPGTEHESTALSSPKAPTFARHS